MVADMDQEQRNSDDAVEGEEEDVDFNEKKREGEGDGEKKRKKIVTEDLDSAKERGICYLSRVPPHMNPGTLRKMLSEYGEVQRLYLAPQDPEAQINRKRVGGYQGTSFSEGWVEFANKSVAKRVANMLNGEQIGGKRRSKFYYEIWNIKYLSKFKWDDLTNETAHNKRSRDQKLVMEISAARRERDFYMSKVDQSRALKFVKERLMKRQKLEETNSGETTANVQEPKVLRQFPQNRPISNRATQNKPRLSKDFLAEVFGGAS